MTEIEADLSHSGAKLAELRPALDQVRALSDADLTVIVEDPAASLACRHAAGLVLAMIGDPRLVAEAPQMIDLPAAEVAIGLVPERVDAVVRRWAAVGVERDWIAKETPRHVVSVGAFRIGRYPVTNAEWLAYVSDVADAPRPTAWPHGSFPLAASNQPVFTLAPEDADGYAAWLAARTGRAFRLPTEAEWEYAAAGPDGREFPWGDDWDPQRANTAEAGPLTTTPVGIYVEGCSPFGVADLAGNVEEYVSDHYRPYPGAAAVNDDLVGVHGAVYRVARGGSFARHGDLVRCARRHGWFPSPHYAMGFRLAESV